MLQNCINLGGILSIKEAIDKDSNNNLIYSKIGNSAFQNSGIQNLNFSELAEISQYSFFLLSSITNM